MIEQSLIWVLVMIVTAAIEAVTAGLVSIWFTIGAVFAFLASFATENIQIQIGVFIATSAIALLGTRPLVKKKLVVKKECTNADMVIGQSGTVVEDIVASEGSGQVKVMGKIWSAKSDDSINAGSTVKITGISGIKLTVEKQ